MEHGKTPFYMCWFQTRIGLMFSSTCPFSYSILHSNNNASFTIILKQGSDKFWNPDVVICTQIISHPNNLFEIMSKEPVKRERNLHNRVQSKRGSDVKTHRGVSLVGDLLACGQISFIAVSC